MSITVTVRDQAGARDEGRTTLVEGISEQTTLRDLIRTRVRDEVARYNAGPTDVFEGLVMPEGAKQTRRGYEMPRRRRIDWEKQSERALESFAANGFFVLVDDRQVTDLDAELDLTPESDIRFVRLVQLVGG